MPKRKPATKRPRAEDADDSADLSSTVGETIREYFDNLIRVLTNTFDAQLKEMREEFSSREFDLKTKHEKLEKELNECKQVNAKLKDETNEQKNIIHNIHQRLCDNEQQTRKNSIKIYGLREVRKHETVLDTTHLVLEFLNAKMGVRVGIQDICTSHRLGKPEPNRYRSVIVKFARRLTKFEVLENRYRLKGSGIVVAEDLSPSNTKLFWEMRDNFGQQNVWTRDCKIYVNTRDGPRQVNHENKLEVLGLPRYEPRHAHHASTPARGSDQRPRPQQGRPPPPGPHGQRARPMHYGDRREPADRRTPPPPRAGRGRASPRGHGLRAAPQQPPPPGVGNYDYNGNEPIGARAFSPPPLRGFARGQARFDDA